MIDITHKISSLRTATAQAVITLSEPTAMEAVIRGKVPKGNVFEFSRAAGLLAIKQTGHVIPDCHPLPIESARIEFEIINFDLTIECTVTTIYKTGVEMEALHGAAVTALTIYDMVKPLDKNMQIGGMKIIQKTGGKSDFRDDVLHPVKAGILVCSDSVASGKKQDKAGSTIKEILSQHKVEATHYEIVTDDAETIQTKVKEWVAGGANLILVCGGTGLSKRDTTPEAIRPLISRDIPGIMEAARTYGQERMPYAMLSRGVSGMIDDCLILTLPGSSRGARESMHALFPHLLHIFAVQKGTQHTQFNNQ